MSSGASQTALVDGWKLNVSDPPRRAWLFDKDLSQPDAPDDAYIYWSN